MVTPTGPASADEVNLWELERLDRKLRALACECIDETPRSYTRDPRYQRIVRLLEETAENRAEIERRLR